MSLQYAATRDDMANASDTRRTTRFGSIVPLSTYRPSYSGGTYKSSGIRKDLKSSTNWMSLNKDTSVRETPTSTTTKQGTAANTSSTESDNKLSSSIYYATPSNTLNKSKPRERTIPSSTISSSRPTLAIAKIQSISNGAYSTANPSKTIKSLYSPSTNYGDKTNVKQDNTNKTSSSSDTISYKEASSSDTLNKSTMPEVSSEAYNEIGARTAANYSRTEQCDKMVEVTVCTRGTSPNLCSTVPTFTRCRRAEIAKTIEKVILRPINKAPTADKEIQSDRMDDTSKYCRFSTMRSTQPWLSRLDQKYDSGCYTRYSSPSQSEASCVDSYTLNARNEKNSSESTTSRPTERVTAIKYKESPLKLRDSSSSKSPSVSRTSSSIRSKSTKCSEKSTSSDRSSSSRSSSDTSQRTPSISPSKQRVCSNKTLPPPAPKSESPSKTVRTSSTSSINGGGSGSGGSTATTADPSGKWQNKDFRKSALNVGPSDRGRKHQDTSAKSSHKQMSSQRSVQSSGRSSSVSSETSVSSANDNADDIVLKNLLNLKISSASSSLPTTTSTTHSPHDASNAYGTACTQESNTQMNIDRESMPIMMTKLASPSLQSNEQRCFIGDDKAINNLAYTLNTTHLIDIKTSASDKDTLDGPHRCSHRNDSNDYTLTNYTTNETSLSNGNSCSMDEQTLSNAYDDQSRSSNIDDSSSATSAWLNTTVNGTGMKSIKSDASISEGDDTTVTESTSVPWWMSFDDDKTTSGKKCGKYRITHVQSGERAWWMDDDTEETVNKIIEAANAVSDKIPAQYQNDESNSVNDNYNSEENTYRNLDSELKSESVEEDQDIDFWATINDSLEANKLNQKTPNTQRMPMEQRVGPEGLENSIDQKTEDESMTAFDRIDDDPIFKKFFISRHQNIDDVLGGYPCYAFNADVVDNNNNNVASLEDGTSEIPLDRQMEPIR